MERYATLNEFFRHYVKENRKAIFIEDIDELEVRLRSAGYRVKENKNGTVTVRTPDEIETSRSRRLTLQMKEASKYTKLGAAIPVPLAREFSAACRKLCLTQSKILMPLIVHTINRANE